MPERRIDFQKINQAALPRLPDILKSWLPDGRIEGGKEWVALNPTRADRNPGSFKINITSGVWCDFATGDRGRDPIALSAYLFGTSMSRAALNLAYLLGIDDPYV